MTLIIVALLANAIAHVVSFMQLSRIKAPNSTGVLVFVFINALIAILLWQRFEWGHYLALVFPLLGGLALLISTILQGKGNWIDYIILVLDIVIVFLVLNFYII